MNPVRVGADPGLQHSWELQCRRCGGTRWVHEATADIGAPYTCIRCRAAQAGRNVADPKDAPTEAQQRARKAAGERLRLARRHDRLRQGVDRVRIYYANQDCQPA